MFQGSRNSLQGEKQKTKGTLRMMENNTRIRKITSGYYKFEYWEIL